MKRHFSDFFAEANGQLSGMRLMSFMTLCVALILVTGPLWGHQVDLATVITLLSAAFGGKVAQKAMESNGPNVPVAGEVKA